MKRQVAGITMVVVGEALIILHRSPVSDYYFPVVWYGYILTLDGALIGSGRRGLVSRPALFASLVAASSGFWWVFEWFNGAVDNWWYKGGTGFPGTWHSVYATVCFSTVLPAVWETAICVDAFLSSRFGGRRLMPVHGSFRVSHRVGAEENTLIWGLEGAPVNAAGRGHATRLGVVLPQVMALCFVLGLVCVAVPVLFPEYAFGLIWFSLFLLLDPLNYLLGRPSVVAQAWSGNVRVLLAFAVAGPICGFFWESWNYWSTVKWVYEVPHIPQWKIFEMPVLGYTGYVPFGLEVYAASVFAVPTLIFLCRRVGWLGRGVPAQSQPERREAAV